MNKYLWKLDPRDSGFEFLIEKELPTLGFQSLYAVPESSATLMEAKGTFAGYTGTVLGGEYLWIDCDTPEAAAQAAQVAAAQGLAYQVWSTGNRGSHVAIKRAIDHGPGVPAADKAWVAKHVPLADLKLYTALHLIRRPGAIHAKTGLRKRKIFEAQGQTLLLTPVLPQEPTAREPHNAPFTSVFADPLITALSVPHPDGQRTDAFKTLGMHLAAAGASLEFITEWFHHVNVLGDPWPSDKVESLAVWCFQSDYASLRRPRK